MNALEKNPTSRGLSRWKNAVGAQVESIKRFVSDLGHRGALREEIAQLDRAGNLDRLLDDLGMTRWELNKIARSYPEAERLLPTMAYHLGIDLEKLEAHTLYALRHDCSLCNEHRACRHWLSSGATTGHAAFCPNAALLDTLRRPKQSV